VSFPSDGGGSRRGLALFSASGSRGEKPGGKAAPASTGTDRSPTNGFGDAQEVEAFFDELIPKQLEERRIPGATVAVVSDGRPHFAKGYGWADVEQRMPVAASFTSGPTPSCSHGRR